jgi:NADP-dependent 3-hydroxy acid dehydrogenase YdfG
MRLAGKVAIVTGAGSGFGRGIAEAFAEEGAKVIVADIHATRAADVAAGIGSRAVPVTVDVTVKSHVEQMMRAAMSAFGGIDILVNNAGITHKNQSLMTVTEEDFDRIYAVNVKSIYLTTLAVVPEMEKRGGGSIINTASTAGLRPRPGLTWYNGSKARSSRSPSRWRPSWPRATFASTPSIRSSARRACWRISWAPRTRPRTGRVSLPAFLWAECRSRPTSPTRRCSSPTLCRAS